jgi:predicted metal-dependent RNase
LKVTFFGGADEVGRSCIKINSGKTSVLLDAGVKIGQVTEYPDISKEQLGSIEAVFISHSHLDHVGFLPHLFSMGYRGTVYTTKPTMELSNVIISDYMRISNPKDVTKEGLARMSKSYKVVEFGEEVKVGDLRLKFIPSGHIVGSSMISVTDGKTTLLYSGDINLTRTKLLEGADIRNLNAKVLIMESTYGGRKDIFPKEGVVMQKALKSIKETINAGGKIIIPSFAVGRAQEVLLLLDDYINSGLLPKVPIYVDGMINKAMRIHRHNVIYCRQELQRRILMSDYDPFKSSNFIPVESKAQRSKVAAEGGSAIIVTTSGMITGGPVMYYLAKLGGNPANKLILVGYQAEGTPGRQIKDGVKRVKLDNTMVNIGLTVESSHLSAHADRGQLEKLIKSVHGLKTIFIIHGESGKSEELKEDMSKNYHAIVPKRDIEYEV